MRLRTLFIVGIIIIVPVFVVWGFLFRPEEALDTCVLGFSTDQCMDLLFSIQDFVRSLYQVLVRNPRQHRRDTVSQLFCPVELALVSRSLVVIEVFADGVEVELVARPVIKVKLTQLAEPAPTMVIHRQFSLRVQILSLISLKEPKHCKDNTYLGKKFLIARTLISIRPP